MAKANKKFSCFGDFVSWLYDEEIIAMMVCVYLVIVFFLLQLASLPPRVEGTNYTKIEDKEIPRLVLIVPPSYRNKTMPATFKFNPFCMYSSITEIKPQPFLSPYIPLNVTKPESSTKPVEILKVLSVFEEPQTATDPVSYYYLNSNQSQSETETIPAFSEFSQYRMEEAYSKPHIQMQSSILSIYCPITKNRTILQFCLGVCPLRMDCKRIQ